MDRTSLKCFPKPQLMNIHLTPQNVSYLTKEAEVNENEWLIKFKMKQRIHYTRDEVLKYDNVSGKCLKCRTDHQQCNVKNYVTSLITTVKK